MIWFARKFIGDQLCLRQLIEQYGYYTTSIIGVQSVPDHEIYRYDISDGREIHDRLFSVNNLVEKPKQKEGTSNIAIMDVI